MTFFQLFILALVQGITEFLPISSSAHLILSREAFNWPDPGANLDVAVHVGTLLAVMLYFRRDVFRLLTGGLDIARRRPSPQAQLALGLIIATLPVLIIGFVLAKTGAADLLRQPDVIAWATIGFALPLYLADKYQPARQRLADLNWRAYLLVGLAQAMAVIPGASRAGVTITAARGLGMNREEAAHLSMLMAIPTILAAGSYAGLDLYVKGDLQLGLDALIAALLAFLTALAAIWGLMKWLQSASFTPFVVYRLILGTGLLYWIYF